MKNFKPLLKQELLRYIYSLKFTTMTIFAVIITLLCVYVQILDFQDRKIIYDEEIIKAKQGLESIKVYSYAEIPIVIEPNPLSIFCKGVDDKIGNKVDISLLAVPEFKKISQKKNSFLDIFLTFDLITLVQIIFSVMTLFLVADAISGEREESTLKLIFSSSVLRFEYFFTKFISSIIVLAIPLTFIFLITSVVILFQPFISLSGTQWGIILLFFIMCLLFISIYVLIGLIISAVNSSASSSVLFGLLVWICLVFLYPNFVNYLVNSTVKVPSADLIDKQLSDIHAKISEKVDNSFEKYDGPASYNNYYGGDFGLPWYIGITQKNVFELWDRRVKKAIPLILEEQEQVVKLNNEAKLQFIKQKEISRQFLRMSPGLLLEESASKIAGTHYLYRDLEIMKRVSIVREKFIDYMKSKDVFGLRFFSNIKREDMRENIDDYTDDLKKKYSGLDTCKPLDLSDMPEFKFPNKSLIPEESLIDILLMLFFNIILFMIGSYFFSRSDLRSRQ